MKDMVERELDLAMKKFESARQKRLDTIEHLFDLPDTLYDSVMPENPLTKQEKSGYAQTLMKMKK